MTTIRHGGPCGLRIEMRSDERDGLNPWCFIGMLKCRWYGGTHAQRGGCTAWLISGLACTTATFVYLSHSAVVIPFESAGLALPTREKVKRTRATPPQTGGSCDLGVAALCTARLYPGPMGVALVLIYPCGKARNTPPFPLALHRVGSVLAVQGSLRRFAPWTAPGRSERRAAYEGKGGVRARGSAEPGRVARIVEESSGS